MCQQIGFARSLLIWAIFAVGSVSTFGQSLARNDNRSERKPPTSLNAQANGLRKLPFEQSIIIYYNVPVTAPPASVPKSPSIRDETSKAGGSAATSRPRIQTQPNATQQQAKNLAVLEPIVIYYPGSPKAALANAASTLPTKGAISSAEPIVRTKPGAVDLSAINIESKQPALKLALVRSFSSGIASSSVHSFDTLSGASSEDLQSTSNESASGSGLASSAPSADTAQQKSSLKSPDTNEPSIEKWFEKTEPLPMAPETVPEVAAATSTKEVSVPIGSTEIALENVNSTDGPIAMNNSAVEMTMDAKYPEAESLFERAIAAQPKNAKFHRNLSVVFERMNKLDEALASARTAASFAPSDPLILDQLCVLELGHGSAASAAECYEKLNSVKPLDVLAQAYYGTALFRSGKIKESESVLEKAAQSTPLLAEALNALGVVYFTTKRIDEAINTFKNGVEADPELCDVRYNLAIAYLSIHNRPAALSQYSILKNTNSKLADQLYRALFSDKLVFVDKMKSKDR